MTTSTHPNPCTRLAAILGSDQQAITACEFIAHLLHEHHGYSFTGEWLQAAADLHRDRMEHQA